MRKMSDEQRTSYLAGLIDMLVYQTALAGNSGKAICITKTFYREERDKALRELFDTFEAYPEKRPEIVLAVLADRSCGK